ncbi:MAG: dipeptide ABC transporter permease DppC, partial [Mesorhizobium sp.]
MSQSTEIAQMAAGNPDRLTGFRTFWHYFSVNRGAVIGLFV